VKSLIGHFPFVIRGFNLEVQQSLKERVCFLPFLFDSQSGLWELWKTRRLLASFPSAVGAVGNVVCCPPFPQRGSFHSQVNAKVSAVR
jgi:hypothetical protein